MNSTAYGCPDGIPLFYFHGAPGAPVEAAALHDAAVAHGIRLLVVERNQADELNGEDYLQGLAQQVRASAAGYPIRLLGFSIGACLALRVAARLEEHVAAIYLLSAAAPLEIPDNRIGMGAGRHTFHWAQQYPRLFLAFARYQAWLAKLNPRLLLRLLFAGAGGSDRALLSQPQTHTWLANIQRDCFQPGISRYVRDIRLYVEPWAEELGKVSAAVSLWHGDADNWAPPAMSSYLAQHLPHVTALTQCAGQAHYSCLLANAQAVMAQVQRSAARITNPEQYGPHATPHTHN